MKKLLILSVLLIFFSNLFSQSYPIGHKQFNFVDPARNRTIQTEVYYPATAAGDNTPFATGQFPLLVFGHGFSMSWDAYKWYWDSLTPRGYILAFPRTEGGLSPNHGAFGEDLKFLNNYILSENNNSSSFFYGKLSGTSAIMGHSMGGGSSVLACANNTNLTTLVNFAAAETNPSAIAAAANVTVPSVLFYGLNDGVTKPNEHQIPIYNALASQCKTLIGIIGGGHCYFAGYNFNCNFGESTTSPQPTITREQQQYYVFQLLYPYLEYKLKGDANAEQLFYQRLNNMTTITYQRSCLMNNDLSMERFISPANSCGLSPTQQVSVLIKNKGANPASNFNVGLIVNNQTPIVETFNGTIASGDSAIFTFTATINAGTPGATYNFTAYASLANDEYVYNDTITTSLTNSSVALPQSVDFTGFTGANLSTVFPGWKEAQGIVPTGTTSQWVNRSGLGGTSNVTAKVNFYSSPIREWITGPGFLCTPYTTLFFDVAVTAYNSNNAYASGMGNNDSLRVFISQDCGATWKRLTAFGKNAGFTNTLQTKTIDLSAYAGTGIAIAFQAFRETSSANDYDLHIDNILIRNQYPYDLALQSIVSPVQQNCFGQEIVKVVVYNNGASPVDFSATPANIEVAVNSTTAISYSLQNRTINPQDTIHVIAGTVDLTTQSGTVNITAQINFSQDAEPANNSSSKTLNVTNPSVAISGNTQICNGQQTTLTANASATGIITKTFTNDTDYNIPDNLGNGVTSPITVSGLSPTMLANQVKAVIIDSIIHPYVGDLRIELYAPNNSTIILVNKRGTSGDNFIGTVFSPTATTPITSIISTGNPFTGNYLPEGNFANLTGSANGQWTLKVADLGIGDVGTLKKWSIVFEMNNQIVSYTWSDNQTTASITISPAQNETYTITVTDLNNCMAVAQTNVQVAGALPQVDLGNDQEFCAGNFTTLNAGSGFSSYLWNNGATTSTLTVSTSGSYWVSVSNQCGSAVDTVVVTVNPLPTVDLGGNQTICDDASVTLDAGNFVSYQWSTQETTSTITVDGSIIGQGTHLYSVSVTDANGCSASDAVEITVTVCSSIAENQTLETIQLYPNPAKEKVLIQNTQKGDIIQVYNPEGKLISEVISNGNTNEINCSNWGAGVYYIRITGKMTVNFVLYKE